MVRLTLLQQQIIATLAYTDQFQYPLDEESVWSRLIAVPDEKKVTRTAFKRALAELQKLDVIIKGKGKRNEYVLKGSEAHFEIAAQRRIWSRQKWQEVSWLATKLARIPWVKGVAVTGSVAMNNATQDDDVDVLIVTAPHRLWLSRLLVILLAWWKGKRRSWHGEEKNSWCFNLWLDEQALAMPERNRSLYGAYEVVQAQFVVDKTGVRKRFYAQNRWVMTYLPRCFSQLIDQTKKSRVSVPQPGWLSWGWNRVESISFMLQRWYMQSHMTREVVTRQVAFFHPRDTRSVIEKKWLQAMSTILGKQAAQRFLEMTKVTNT